MKNTLRTLLIFILISSFLKADNKPTFIMVYDQSCNACKETIKIIATNKKLSNAILTLTKPFQMTTEEAAKNNLLVRTVPTFFILDTDTGKMLTKPLEGAIKDPNDFTRFLEQIYSALNS